MPNTFQTCTKLVFHTTVFAESASSCQVKLADFGNAMHATPEHVSLYYDGFELQSPLYRAPEVEPTACCQVLSFDVKLVLSSVRVLLTLVW
jgi:hypothetical protein